MTSKDVAGYLNDLLYHDPEGMSQLMLTSVPFREGLKIPTVGGEATPLGLINGLLSDVGEHPLWMGTSEARDRVLWFDVVPAPFFPWMKS